MSQVKEPTRADVDSILIICPDVGLHKIDNPILYLDENLNMVVEPCWCEEEKHYVTFLQN